MSNKLQEAINTAVVALNNVKDDLAVSARNL